MQAGRPLLERSSTPGEGCRVEIRSNPMQRSLSMHLSPRCGAKTRSGRPGRSPAMSNGRCRMHGGCSPGAPKGERNGNYKGGRFTCEAIARRRALSAWVRQMSKLVDEVEG